MNASNRKKVGRVLLAIVLALSACVAHKDPTGPEVPPPPPDGPVDMAPNTFS